MPDVTRILSQIVSGDLHAADELLPLIYEELRKLAAARLAHEKPGQTLGATALVHEAYLRLVGPADRGPQHWEGRSYFFAAAAAEAMRRILVDNARRKTCAKHGGHLAWVEFDEGQLAVPGRSLNLIALDEALDQLTACDARKAELVKLHSLPGSRSRRLPTRWGSPSQLPTLIGLTPRRGCA